MATYNLLTEDEYREFARQKYQMDELVAEFDGIQRELAKLKEKREQLLEENIRLQEISIFLRDQGRYNQLQSR